VISSELNGLTMCAAPQETSGIDDVLDVITGILQDIASNIGIPKLSLSDGYKRHHIANKLLVNQCLQHTLLK
jgi:hypothetical protein